MQTVDAAQTEPERPARAAPKPLWIHGLGLLVLLLALLPLVGTGAVFSADEGAAIVQARRLVEEGTWVGSHPLPSLDPAIIGYPVHLAQETSEGWHELSCHPAYIHVIAGAFSIGGFPAMVLVSILATAAAALVAGDLAGRLEQRLAVPTLWVVGLASPLVFDSYLVIAHSLGALAAALTAWFLIGRWSSTHLVAGAVACGATVWLRSEGLLLGLGVAAALLLTGGRGRHRPRLFAGVVAGVASVGAYLADGWWTDSLKEPTVGTAGVGIARFQGGLDGRWEGFERTWLWVGRGGLTPGDELILLAVLVAAGAALAIRLGARGAVVSALGATSAALVVVRVLTDPTAIVPGLLFAFPLLLIGLVLLGPRQLDLGSGRGRDLVVASALFSLAVVATQYSVGGTTEWGGRYFALALPLICPVIVAAVLDGADRLDRRSATRWLASVVVLSLALPTMGLLGLRRTHHRTEELVDTVAAGIERAGPDAIVVTDVNPLARWSWTLVDDLPWALVATDDLPVAVDLLAAADVENVVYVGHRADDQVTEWERRYTVTSELRPAFDESWQVVVLQ